MKEGACQVCARKMQIKGFIESSLLEWEGKVSSVLFLPHCNLRCRYCHAGDLVLAPEQMETVPFERVAAYLRAQRGWVDAVAVTGGEPALHGRELVDLTERLHEFSVDVMVETNGTRPDVVEELIEENCVDVMSMDVKAPLNPTDYRRVTDAEVDIGAVRRSINLIRDSGLPHEFRITLVPGLVGEDELRGILPELEGARAVALQNFRPDDCLSPELHEVMPFRPEQMDAFGQMARGTGERCIVRGREHALTT